MAFKFCLVCVIAACFGGFGAGVLRVGWFLVVWAALVFGFAAFRGACWLCFRFLGLVWLLFCDFGLAFACGLMRFLRFAMILIWWVL